MSRFRRGHGSPRGRGRSRVLSMIMGFGILLILLKLGTDQVTSLLEKTDEPDSFQILPLSYQGSNRYKVGKESVDFDRLALLLLEKVDSMRQGKLPIQVEISVPDTLGSARVADLLRIVQGTAAELDIQTYSTVQ